MTGQRKEAKARTRARLLDAIAEILHDEGPTALTTGRIAEAAGVAQPTFYVHFASLDDALEAAADDHGARLVGHLREHRARLDERAGGEVVRAAYAATIDALLADRRLATLFLRHRRDATTPFGRRFRKVLNEARADVERDLASLGVPDASLHATLVIGMVIAVVEATLERRVADRDAATRALAHWTRAALAGLVGRA